MEWTWNSGCCQFPGSNCYGATTITLARGRLEYRGFCADPGFGGGYWIDDQEIDNFLANGPSEPVPDRIVAQIRAALT
jgi:hypothetical protein